MLSTSYKYSVKCLWYTATAFLQMLFSVDCFWFCHTFTGVPYAKPFFFFFFFNEHSKIGNRFVTKEHYHGSCCKCLVLSSLKQAYMFRCGSACAEFMLFFHLCICVYCVLLLKSTCLKGSSWVKQAHRTICKSNAICVAVCCRSAPRCFKAADTPCGRRSQWYY